MQKSQSFSCSKPQLILTVIFLSSNITYFVLAPRNIFVFNLLEPGGILIFPLTFFLADIITEVYGYPYSRFLIWLVLLMLSFFTLGTWISLHFTAAEKIYNYEHIFSHYPRLDLGISLATFLSFFVNNSILAKLKIKWQGRGFVWRSLLSTALGHGVFTISWAIIFHWGKLNTQALLILIACMYLWKMLFELLATPIAALLSSWLKEHEGQDIEQNCQSFNPFVI